MDMLDEDLVAAVLAASRVLVGIAALSMSASPVEITLSQYRALVVLSSRSTMSVSDLGRALNLSPSSATRLIDRLERKGLLRRRVSPTSRREVELSLTDGGLELVELVMTDRRTRIIELLDSVPADSRKQLTEAFQSLVDAAGEPMELAPAAPTV